MTKPTNTAPDDLATQYDIELATNTWYPIARSGDAPLRHVHHAKLLGQELAVWRADDGFVNVWENRCLHRGVRLSVGSNTGSELKCLYHGWRYASRTAGCTYIPAHPANAPAQTICNQTFPTTEYLGLIWTTFGDKAFAPRSNDSAPANSVTLRSLPINASPSRTLHHLRSYQFTPSALPTGTDLPSGTEDPALDAQHRVEMFYEADSAQPESLNLAVESRLSDCSEGLTFFIQPVDSGLCVVHGVLHRDDADPGLSQADNIKLLRLHAEELERVRRLVEAESATLPAPVPMAAPLRPAANAEVAVHLPAASRNADLRVVVERKWQVADGVVGLELVSINGHLPTTQPGAHIDVHLPNGLVRQYSLTNQSGQQDRYIIGVKLEPESSGGSACIHSTVAEGDVLAISTPRNNFGLRRDAVRSVLIAGGIGITPLLGMAETLAAGDHPFELHYFVRSQKHAAFAERLEALGERLILHVGLDPTLTRSQLETLVVDFAPASHLYVCGPGPFLDATRAAASNAEWPELNVHFEYFKNTNDVDQTSTFEIELARSGVSLQVPENQSVLEVLRSNGISLNASCEQGACGTCVVGVLDGEVHHQDVVLHASEQKRNDRMMTCVSRSASGRLILDI